MDNKFIREWLPPIIVAVLLAIMINKFLIFKVDVPTGSMEPTINIGDKFLVTRVYNFENLKRGDIIVFKNNEKNQVMVKRLIGVPGDEIDIQGEKLYINGDEIKEDYVKYPDKYFGKFKVPEGKYFFLGDNRANSGDSREWKEPYIDENDIKGKVQIRVYPIKNFGSIK
ncbi:signal peptidase I [Clostridium sardiniense]|uniref:Signal peptidase I n=1 Tax=Clostridium sardiniense TaxID=29369 RepID=A0ABS7KSS7_CLOSR|nr:signal peptidase I [Clostridium sardiniense]MBY0753855.1 signal peptidase I [Clostridium sardiniense]MDQ0459630.1 signal peptidase I [Clostridium sardiniense]